MRSLYGVFGAGGCGRGIMPLLRDQVRTSSSEVVFVDDGPVAREINGHPVRTWDEFLGDAADYRAVCLAVANSRIRESLLGRCRAAGVDVLTVRANNAIEMDDVEIGPGAVICPFVTITSNIRIGVCFHANLYSYVEHDCRIGDFVTFAPGVQCNGNVHIHDHAYIGAGAVIRQGEPGKPLVIGAGAIVGMGAVVTKDVLADMTVIGNPARAMIRS